MSRPVQKVSEYSIVRSDNVADFEIKVQECLIDGWQPLNKQGYEASDEFEYVMEMVKMMDEDEYREMVLELYEDGGDADGNDEYEYERNRAIQVPDGSDEVTLRVTEVDRDEVLRKIFGVQGIPTVQDPDPIFDDELFNSE